MVKVFRRKVVKGTSFSNYTKTLGLNWSSFKVCQKLQSLNCQFQVLILLFYLIDLL
ncbi:MAG: hypothetical protein H6Q23_2403 [Bacteroidetes bacterium]|nr:hypothetical protein [Bacteroidota bacterium]